MVYDPFCGINRIGVSAVTVAVISEEGMQRTVLMGVDSSSYRSEDLTLFTLNRN